MPKLPTESDEQIRFVRWFRANHKTLIYSSVNGAKLSAQGKYGQVNKLKSEGMTNGIPDLHIPEWNVWIEMKRSDGGTVSPSQRKMIDYLNSIGHHAFIARGCDAAIAIIQNFLRGKNAH